MPLSPRMPELRSFEVLLAIARTGSLGAAGRELGMTQQTVSTRLVTLENLTGVPLVLRSKRGSRLSPAGAVIAEWAEQLVGVAERLDASIATMRQESRHRIKVAASLTVAEQLMPRWLVSLQVEAHQSGTAAPDVILTAMNSDQVVHAVADGGADLGFVESSRAPKGLRSKIITYDELIVVVLPNHKWARRTQPISAEEIRQTPLVLRESGSGTRDFFVAAMRARLGEEIDIAEPVLELSSVTAIRAAVLAGAGPTVISSLSAADDLERGRLRAVPVADIDLKRQIRAVWSGASTPPAGAVRDVLNHVCRAR